MTNKNNGRKNKKKCPYCGKFYMKGKGIAKHMSACPAKHPAAVADECGTIDVTVASADLIAALRDNPDAWAEVRRLVLQDLAAEQAE